MTTMEFLKAYAAAGVFLSQSSYTVKAKEENEIIPYLYENCLYTARLL